MKSFPLDSPVSTASFISQLPSIVGILERLLSGLCKASDLHIVRLAQAPRQLERYLTNATLKMSTLTMQGLKKEQITTAIDLLTQNLINIKDTTGQFLL